MVSFGTSYCILPSLLNFYQTKTSNKTSNNSKLDTTNKQPILGNNPSKNKNAQKKKYKIARNFFELSLGTKLIRTKDFPSLQLFCGMYVIVVALLKDGYAVIEVPNQSVNHCKKYKLYYSNF